VAMISWRVTKDEQNQKDDLTRKLADAEIGRRRFTSDMLVNLERGEREHGKPGEEHAAPP
jgi:hypothetical protein